MSNSSGCRFDRMSSNCTGRMADENCGIWRLKPASSEVDSLLQDTHRLESLPARSVRPVCAEVVEQALIAAGEIGTVERARAYDCRLQIAIAQRDGQRRLAFQHRLPLMEAAANG